MRAIQVHEFADPSRVEVHEVDDAPEPGRGKVRLAVAGVGIGYFDGLLVSGQYQIRPELPFVPGSSMAGIIESIGEGVTHLQPGQAVAAFALHGGLAERVVLPAASCVPLPSSLDPHAAANFFVSWATGLYGLREIGKVQAGETVLVLGAAGSTGTTAIECAKALGARVIAAASTEAKRAHCREHGADEVVDYTEDDWRGEVKAMTDGKGVDAVYDPVGGAMAEPALRLLAPGGRYLVVGFVTGIARIPLNLPLLKRCSVHGVNWGGSVMADPSVVPPVLKTLVQWAAEGRIDAAPEAIYPLARTGEAFAALFARESTGARVVDPRA